MSYTFIGIAIPLIIIEINRQYNLIKELNNQILEQKSTIIKINSICENLLLSKINNYIDNNINETYINYSIIIILLDIILSIILIFLFSNGYNTDIYKSPKIIIDIILIISIVISISIIIILLILYLDNRYIIKNFEEINNKANEIINKSNEIDNKYIINLMIIIDSENNYNYINSCIDEYLLNYSYLFKTNIKNYYDFNNFITEIKYNLNNSHKDKNNFINLELKNKLIKNKNNELINNMKIRLANFDEIIPEIVKYELDEVNKDLEEYKKNLEIKINNLNELLLINSIIIEIDIS